MENLFDPFAKFELSIYMKTAGAFLCGTRKQT